MKKTLIFDLDGTLLNTLADLRDSTNFALRSFGFSEKTTEEIRKSVGNGLKMLITRVLPVESEETKIEQVLRLMKEHYSENYHNKTVPYHGIVPMLEQLSRKEFRMAIVSNKADSIVALLRKQYFDTLISVATGESEKYAKKPAPDMVYAAIMQLNRNLEDTIYIGDSEVDIQTATNAGIPCASVGWGFRSEDDLRNAGAPQIYRTPEELYTALIEGSIK